MEGNSVPRPASNGMRYALTALLGALLFIILGVMTGYLRLDLKASPLHQLSVSRSMLATAFCYFNGCDPDEVDVYEYSHTIDHPEGPLDVYTYSHTEGEDQYGPYYVRDVPDDTEMPYGYYSDYNYDYGGSYDNGRYETWYNRSFPGFGTFVQPLIPPAWSAAPVVVSAPIYVQASTPPAPSPVYAQPSCWISAQPTNIAYGAMTTLSWQSFNASSASLSDFGAVAVSGSRMTQPLTSEHVFSLSVSGAGGSSSCYTRVTVQPPQSAIPTCMISAHPDTVSAGQNSNLAWASNNAQTALLSGVGAVNVNGGMYVAPQQTTAYTLSVYGLGNQSNSCATRIIVQ